MADFLRKKSFMAKKVAKWHRDGVFAGQTLFLGVPLLKKSVTKLEKVSQDYV